jgi:tetratricopeptide repeat protein
MPTTEEPEFLLRRADWELRHAQPYFAYRLYRSVAVGASDLARRRALESALDVCLDYFDKKAEETIEVAVELAAIAGPPNGRALVAHGTALSMKARAEWDRGNEAEALRLSDEAATLLEKAIGAMPFDTDARGTLGGLYKRLAKWHRSRKNEAAGGYLRRMLDAYEKGAELGDPYPLLNYLEYRAVIEKRPKVVPEPPWDNLLERALYIRKQQFARGENAPWAAFDIARAQHYVEPNVPRWLSDLEVAIEGARRVARRASDKWMVETACTSLADLYEANVQVDGLEEGILLVRRAVVDDRWFLGNWGPLGRPEEYLLSELREAHRALVDLAESSRTSQDLIATFVARAESRWSQEDEERFAKELAAFKTDIEPMFKKQLRALWKACGDEALKWAFTAGAPVVAALVGGPAVAAGATVIAVAPMVSAYVKYAINQRLGVP